MSGRTWKNIENALAEKIKLCLLQKGGIKEEIKNNYEGWRVKFSDSTFTFYIKGTIYSTPSNSNDPAVFELWKYIDSLVGSAYVLPTKKFIIGLDETGKGEIVGHTILTGVIFPKEIYNKIDLLIGPADTKKKHKFEYWDEVFKKLDYFRDFGLDFIVEKIPPWHVDIYNLNKIMDVSYQRILSTFFRIAKIDQCRIVLDNYGVGPTLTQFLKFLEIQGAKVIVTNNSENKYLEVKIASLISKKIREGVMQSINEKKEFQIDGVSVGSGNAGDKQTLEWIKKWYTSGKKWPWFIKRSFKTIWQIEGRKIKPRKITPPIKEDLLSREFIEEFSKGHLSIQSLSVVCPCCGSILKNAKFANFNKDGRNISALKCPNPECGKIIEDAGITLRYYCGYVIPDSNAILRNIISNDLAASRFFENFTIILCSVVRKECDGTSRGKKEFEELRRYNAIGRIKLEAIGMVKDLPDNISGTIRDEKIIEDCLKHNAILLTADKSMSTFSIGKNVFTISI